MELIIENLNKEYSNKTQALSNVSLIIKSGMFGLLGPNGAGKSTLMRTLATLQNADSGSVKFGEIDILKNKDATRKILGYLPQEFGVYSRISAIELLDHLALLKGFNNKADRKQMIEQLLVKVNLWSQRKNAVSSYSGGMRQRFGIAQCLIGNPQLVIVDEPTAGLDPGEKNRFYNILSEIGDNSIVILSTHIVQDVRELCTQMGIMNQGSVLFSGNTDEALFLVKEKVFEKKVSKLELPAFTQNFNVVSNKLVGGQPLIRIFSNSNPSNGFLKVEENLEDVFFAKLNKLV